MDASESASETTVLVVDDERPLADIFEQWLRDDYEVEVAYDVSTALEALDERLDVALLDRRLPDGSGDDVLAEIRSRDLDCRVGLVSAVAPDLDVLDLDYDLYVEKPVSNRETLTATVEDLVRWGEYDRVVREYVALRTKHDMLVARFGRTRLANSDRWDRLLARLGQLRERLPDDDAALAEADAQRDAQDSTAPDADDESR
ncbi:response regulator [Halorussus halophilus]|uniref:response regulator n=1 Tax=Halorussus halophilus TaxID=2650975 RepID=UPI00130191C9|nr:response regulator [Halorussus halophilus]